MSHVVFDDTPDRALCGYRFGEQAPPPYKGPATADPCVVCEELDAMLGGRDG